LLVSWWEGGEECRIGLQLEADKKEKFGFWWWM